MKTPEIILFNGKITTLDKSLRNVSAIAISEGKILAIGTDAEIQSFKTDETQLIDLKQRRVIPGLNDSHLHLIRGGLNYNMELRWDGVRSLGDALTMLKQQAARTPAPQWVRVVGGWSEFQFTERRMPTLEEINTAAPDWSPIIQFGGYQNESANFYQEQLAKIILHDHNTCWKNPWNFGCGCFAY